MEGRRVNLGGMEGKKRGQLTGRGTEKAAPGWNRQREGEGMGCGLWPASKVNGGYGTMPCFGTELWGIGWIR